MIYVYCAIYDTILASYSTIEDNDARSKISIYIIIYIDVNYKNDIYIILASRNRRKNSTYIEATLTS